MIRKVMILGLLLSATHAFADLAGDLVRMIPNHPGHIKVLEHSFNKDLEGDDRAIQGAFQFLIDRKYLFQTMEEILKRQLPKEVYFRSHSYEQDIRVAGINFKPSKEAIQYGAYLNLKDNEGLVPLHFALLAIGEFHGTQTIARKIQKLVSEREDFGKEFKNNFGKKFAHFEDKKTQGEFINWLGARLDLSLKSKYVDEIATQFNFLNQTLDAAHDVVTGDRELEIPE